MRQLDLFGSFFETPEKEEKAEAIQPELKKETIPDDIVNKEISYSLTEIEDGTPETEVLKDLIGIIERTAETLKAGEDLELSASFPLSENINLEINPPLVTGESKFDLYVNEVFVEPPTISPDRKELKTDQFDEEAKLEEEKNAVQVENESVFILANTKVNIKKEPQKRGRKSLEEIEAEVDLIEIPEDEVLFKKQYYPISEVAKWFRVNASLLRFWEKEFEVLKPKKNGKGDRLFRPEDVKNLQLIYQLLRQRKYTIEGAREYLKANKKKADVEMQLANTLQKFKIFLLDLRANL